MKSSGEGLFYYTHFLSSCMASSTIISNISWTHHSIEKVINMLLFQVVSWRALAACGSAWLLRNETPIISMSASASTATMTAWLSEGRKRRGVPGSNESVGLSWKQLNMLKTEKWMSSLLLYQSDLPFKRFISFKLVLLMSLLISVVKLKCDWIWKTVKRSWNW